jgi:two-component system sensor histidine kinase PilS (NtrC family)
VQAANPAALQLIGAPAMRRFVAFDLTDLPLWQPLREALARAYADGYWPEGGQELSLRLPQAGERESEERPLRLRMRFTRRHDARSGEALCVLFLEDVRTVRARARQEKLAAMGRVSAGIAHEIRNPLAAIAQANALLAEDLADPAQQRLTRMVADNVERLQRIVDDVAEVSPGAPREAPAIDLRLMVGQWCGEWARTAGLPVEEGSPLFVDPGEVALPVCFDPEHLRRVLVNLLDNALRHGSGQPQAVWVRLSARLPGRVELQIASDGEVIAPDVEPHLFEPFFSTRSRGTGLGLYICRELCERYGASIEFRPRGPGARHRNVFVVTIPLARPVAA